MTSVQIRGVQPTLLVWGVGKRGQGILKAAPGRKHVIISVHLFKGLKKSKVYVISTSLLSGRLLNQTAPGDSQNECLSLFSAHLESVFRNGGK